MTLLPCFGLLAIVSHNFHQFEHHFQCACGTMHPASEHARGRATYETLWWCIHETDNTHAKHTHAKHSQTKMGQNVKQFGRKAAYIGHKLACYCLRLFASTFDSSSSMYLLSQ